ncbi:hypothetical protein F5Y18DRAFT_435791 [Xylariaceae sp. FL1019]|nr:hypothetical protein F5Y18DRAFT_435791 [Xylariaceae sp. FL1019]
MADWNSLPQELKDMIFEAVDLHVAEDRSGTHPRSKLVTVAKEFRAFFERKNFQSLTLSYSDYRWFNIPDSPEFRQHIGGNLKTVTIKPSVGHARHPLKARELKLTIGLKALLTSINHLAESATNLSELVVIPEGLKMPKHSSDGRFLELGRSALRIPGVLNLPTVESISSLAFAYHRAAQDIDEMDVHYSPRLLLLLAECMPNLNQIFLQRALAETIPHWPASITKVTLIRNLSTNGPPPNFYRYMRSSEVEENILQRMGQLEEYHNFFYINATLLKAEQGPWQRLTRLTVTSCYDNEPDPVQAINNLLLQHAPIALSMPKAQSIDLILYNYTAGSMPLHSAWFHSNRFAHFSCEVTRDEVKICLQSNFNCPIFDTVLDKWHGAVRSATGEVKKLSHSTTSIPSRTHLGSFVRSNWQDKPGVIHPALLESWTFVH